MGGTSPYRPLFVEIPRQPESARCPRAADLESLGYLFKLYYPNQTFRRQDESASPVPVTREPVRDAAQRAPAESLVEPAQE